MAQLPPDVALLLIGGEHENRTPLVETLLKRYGVADRVLLYGRVPYAEMLVTLSDATLGLVVYRLEEKGHGFV